MYCKIDKDYNVIASSAVPLEGFIEVKTAIKNTPFMYKLVDGELFINANKFNPKDVEEFDDKLDNVNPDDADLINSKRVSIFNKGLKQKVREKIRRQKDLEDDLTDTKQALQYVLYGFLDMFEALPTDITDKMNYKDNVSAMAQSILSENVKMRVDVEPNQLQRFAKIIQDEVTFANIAKTEYLDKKL